MKKWPIIISIGLLCIAVLVSIPHVIQLKKEAEIIEDAKIKMLKMTDSDGNRRFPRSKVAWITEDISAEHEGCYLIIFTLDRGYGEEQFTVVSDSNSTYALAVEHDPDFTDDELFELLQLTAKFFDLTKEIDMQEKEIDEEETKLRGD